MLVVDDDERLREFMRVNLELEGYTVREAASADEALAALEDQAPELVLLDVVMPGIDGWQMLQRMQERHGSIPVIMFSGQVDDQLAADVAEPRCKRLRRQAVRPAAADRARQAARPGLTVREPGSGSRTRFRKQTGFG